MKLALGTVQFGLDYGINNSRGVPDSEEIIRILNVAAGSGIDTIDTAMDYGDSESKIGALSGGRFKVVTKLPAIPDDKPFDDDWLFSAVKGAIKRLDSDHLYGLLLHRPKQLLERDGSKLYAGLLKLKQAGLIKKFGISIYDPAELDLILNFYDVDIVQSPLNVLDTRLVTTGWMSKLNAAKVELHVRSVFLQGLLLMPRSERPAKFDKWSTVWREYEMWLHDNNMTPLEACIRYAVSFDEIDKVIVGTESSAQLKSIISSVPGKCPGLPDIFENIDMDLLSPVNWTKLK